MNAENNVYVLMGATIVAGVMGAVYSTANAVIILGFCSVVFSQLYSQLNAIKAAKDAAEKVQDVKVATNVAAQKVEEVRRTQQADAKVAGEKMDDLATIAKDAAEVGHATHTLVNSNMAAQMKIAAVALRRLAEHTNHPDDLAAANLAEKLLREHEEKQADVDARGGKAPAVGSKEVKAITRKAEEIKDEAKKISDKGAR